MQLINKKDLKPGMILAQDVFDHQSGTVYLKRGVRLSEQAIRRLDAVYPKDLIYVYKKQESLQIISTVELENDQKRRLKSDQIEMMAERKLKQKRKSVNRELNEMSDVIRNSIYNLNINMESPRTKEHINDLSKKLISEFDNYPQILENVMMARHIDDYLYRHSVNVSAISVMIGKWMGLEDDEMEILAKAGILHDIGKIKVDQDVLNKPGKLTKDEFDMIKKHSAYGYEMIKELDYVGTDVSLAVLMHHEKEDGSGYPLGFTSNKISRYAKILAVADIFDAMTSNRVYHRKKSPFEVLEMFQKNSFGYLDLETVMVFIKNFANYYIGTKVVLNDGQIGKIVRIDINNITKPLLHLDNGFVDMNDQSEIMIQDFYYDEI